MKGTYGGRAPGSGSGVQHPPVEGGAARDGPRILVGPGAEACGRVEERERGEEEEERCGVGGTEGPGEGRRGEWSCERRRRLVAAASVQEQVP
jgi:hypothetical protein